MTDIMSTNDAESASGAAVVALLKRVVWLNLALLAACLIAVVAFAQRPVFYVLIVVAAVVLAAFAYVAYVVVPRRVATLDNEERS
jgi:hypothetical protein